MGTRAPSTKARPAAVVRTPQQSAERRAGHGPVISGDPEIGPLARRTIGCGASAPALVGALLPSFCARRIDTAQPARPYQRAPKLWHAATEPLVPAQAETQSQRPRVTKLDSRLRG